MSIEDRIRTGDNGFPVLLATRAPGQVAAQPDPSGVVVQRGARSGNPKADPATGRFAGGTTTRNGEIVQRSRTRTIPANIDPEAWQRRQDLVRRAAAEFEEMGLGDAKEWLKAHVKSIASVNVDLFIADVRAQRLDYLADILDHQLTKKVEGMQRARRMVRVQAPKGWERRVFANLDDEEVVKLVRRLEGHGWDPEDLTTHVIGRVKDEARRTKLEQSYGESRPKRARKAK